MILVTGAAGFIGSRLVERLRGDGECVRVVDRRDGPDLRTTDIEPLLDGVDVVFHLAARTGVRPSWDDFEGYVDDNVVITQRLLDAVHRRGTETTVVYASSSSVYGNAARYPCREEDAPAPHSPYGVTKLAAEHLIRAYAANHGLHAVALRYFTVYGPGQRSDMAIHRMVEAALGRTASGFPLYGDGSAVRDFTYVDDVVDATIRAAGAAAGSVFNVAGGGSTTVRHVLDLVGDAVGRPVPVDRRPAQPGDVDRTGGSIDRIADALGWTPGTDLATGVASQVEWQRRHGE